MNEVYRTSEYWLHPCTGVELYCITGIKAQASGCWPVIIPAMALSETVKYGTFSTKENYASDLIEALSKPPNPPINPYPTWQTCTLQLAKMLDAMV